MSIIAVLVITSFEYLSCNRPNNSSFEESVGFPVSQVATEYWFLWYDQLYMDTWRTMAVP